LLQYINFTLAILLISLFISLVKKFNLFFFIFYVNMVNSDEPNTYLFRIPMIDNSKKHAINKGIIYNPEFLPGFACLCFKISKDYYKPSSLLLSFIGSIFLLSSLPLITFTIILSFSSRHPVKKSKAT